MNLSTPGLPVHHQLPESTQTHVHCVGDAIQPSHPLSSPSPPALNLSQHQGLFKWVSSSHQVAKVLEFQLQHQSSMNTQDWSPLEWTSWISFQSKEVSRVFSNIFQQIWNQQIWCFWTFGFNIFSSKHFFFLLQLFLKEKEKKKNLSFFFSF